MKYTLFALLGLLLTAAIHAQTPQLMSYQAIIRNGNNQLVANAPVGMRVSILQGSANGSAAYVERHTPTTNANGLAMIAVGGGTALSGTFASINWANGPYFIKTETDPAGGSNYIISSTSQLLSVPYALHSANATLATMATTAANGVPSGAVQGQVITFCDGVPVWTNGGLCPGKITALNCGSATNSGTLTSSLVASGVSSSVPYTGGNGGVYAAQSINSTGVTGLTATLEAGTLAIGVGTLTYTISGTPSSTGTASFLLSIGGQACTVQRSVAAVTYPAGAVHCGGNPATIVNVTNPTTGKIWMDRNMGASQVATSSTDANAYGDLYQWGRRSDGHQCRNSGSTTSLSSIDQPSHGNFILAPSSPYDWRSPQNTNLWQGVNGVNNPCPTGHRIPTSAEFDAERASWSSNSSIGAYASPLKSPLGGSRYSNDGSLISPGINGGYWSSTVNGTAANYLNFNGSNANINSTNRANGCSVRCIKD